jgi:hypothetical protein
VKLGRLLELVLAGGEVGRRLGVEVDEPVPGRERRRVLSPALEEDGAGAKGPAVLGIDGLLHGAALQAAEGELDEGAGRLVPRLARPPEELGGDLEGVRAQVVEEPLGEVNEVLGVRWHRQPRSSRAFLSLTRD